MRFKLAGHEYDPSRGTFLPKHAVSSSLNPVGWPCCAQQWASDGRGTAPVVNPQLWAQSWELRKWEQRGPSESQVRSAGSGKRRGEEGVGRTGFYSVLSGAEDGSRVA